MKGTILAIVTFFLITSPVYATPLTWFFSGTTGSSSKLDNMSISGLAFQMRIFLDTDLVGTKPAGLSDEFFTDPPQGPHFFPIQGEVEIAQLGVFSLNPFTKIAYFLTGNGVTGVEYYQPFFSEILFPSSISGDTTHLTPIGTSAPLANSHVQIDGLGSDCFLGKGLCVTGDVTSFSAAATAVPEGGSSVPYFIASLAALGLLRRRFRTT